MRIKPLVRLLCAVSAALALCAVAAQAGRAFTPDDPLVDSQWYLAQDSAFDYWPDAMPTLAPVRVAVVDSGIDYGHPDFAGRIVGGKSFVGGSWKTDTEGHGTFVAGLIAAGTNDGIGIAGIAFPAQLLIAKVVARGGAISTEDEAKGIRWAADNGARVINLSIGGLRDPFHPKLDLYSPEEEAAIDYAYRRGALVVAAVGNSDDTPSEPWPFADYPAALAHVVGVGAIGRSGAVPAFSNRDAVYNDLVAPGQGIVSTFPRQLTAKYPACLDQGYSVCGGPDYRPGEGTSFAVPQVVAAGALLLAANPRLRPDQVAALLEHSAEDANAANGCRRCTPVRDRLSGWGRLDVAAALDAAAVGVLPAPDRFEPNDEAGPRAWTLRGPAQTVRPTIDFWDDQVDVYRLYVRRGQTLYAAVSGPDRADLSLQLWRPGTTQVEGVAAQLSHRAVQSRFRTSRPRLHFTARASGWYYLETKIGSPGYGAYTLSFTKR